MQQDESSVIDPTIPEREPRLEIYFSPFPILRLMLCFNALFVILYFCTQALDPILHADILSLTFDLDAESTIPTWYSSLLLYFGHCLLAVVAWAKFAKGDKYSRHWALLSLFLLLMSVDETASMHEHVAYRVIAWTGFAGLGGGSWVIPALGLLIVGSILYLPFFRDLPRNTHLRFWLAGGLFVAGSIGVEALHFSGISSSSGSLTGLIYVALEESFEMTGAAVFVFAMLQYIRSELHLTHLKLA